MAKKGKNGATARKDPMAATSPVPLVEEQGGNGLAQTGGGTEAVVERVRGTPGQADLYLAGVRHSSNIGMPLFEMPAKDSSWMGRTRFQTEDEIAAYLGIMAEDFAIDEGYTPWDQLLFYRANLYNSLGGKAREEYKEVAIAERRRKRFMGGGLLNRFRKSGQGQEEDDE